MKKSFLLKLLLFISVIAFSQETRFRIVNAETGSPVSYATVKMLTRPGGAVASGSGTFRMEIRQHDTILVTCVGFAPLKIAGAQVRELITLSPRPAMMPVLVITNRGEGRSLLLGNRQLSKRASAYWGPGSAVEFAQRIALEDPSKLHRVKRIVIPVDAVKCFGPFLLRMYLPDSATMLPGEEIFLEKVVPTRQMVRKNKAYVDVSHQEITVRDVPFFYVSFSWLPEARSGDECLTIMGVTRKDSVEATECVIRTSSFDFQPWNAGRDKNGMPQLLNTFFSVEAEGFAQVSPPVGLRSTLDTTKLHGSWMFERIQFLVAMSDSTEVLDKLKGHFVTMERDGKFESYIVKGHSRTSFHRGTYRWAELPFLKQDDLEVEVIRLDDQYFVVNIDDEMILYYRRVPSTK